MLHGFGQFAFGDTFLAGMSHVDGAGPDEEGLAPGSIECGDVGGVFHHRGAEAVGEFTGAEDHGVEEPDDVVLQLPRFMNDAAPSRPVIYALLT